MKKPYLQPQIRTLFLRLRSDKGKKKLALPFRLGEVPNCGSPSLWEGDRERALKSDNQKFTQKTQMRTPRIKRRYLSVRLTITMILLLLTPNSIAQEKWLVPNLFISTRNFEYSVFNGNVRGHITSLGTGITAIYQRFYLNLLGERNIATKEESIINSLYNTIEFERTDFAGSIGYAVNDSISTFVGYKYGKSTLIELPPSPFAGAKTSLEGKGLFIGAGGWLVKDWGTFSFSAAYAKMVANYDTFSIGTTEGDVQGTSLGIKWKAPIRANFYYDFSLMRHDYYYENFSQIDFDISEQILSLRLGLSYRF